MSRIQTRLTIFAGVLFLSAFSFGAVAADYLLVKRILGNAEYKVKGGRYKRIRSTGTRLKQGMTVRTGAGSYLKLVFSNDEDTEVVMRDAATLRIDKLLARKANSLYLYTGRMKAMVSEVVGKGFEVKTSTATTGVRGTEFAVYADGSSRSTVYVFEGEVNVRPAGQTAGKIVNEGKKVQVFNSGFGDDTASVTDADRDYYNVDPDELSEPYPDEPASADGMDGREEPGQKGGKQDGPLRLEFDLNGDMGPEAIDDTIWTKLILKPTFAIGKFTFAMYLPIYYDVNQTFFNYKNWYNSSEWNFGGNFDWFQDFLLKFHFMQYGLEKGKGPVYVRLGSLEDLSLGNGFIVGGYNNAISFPEVRHVGLDARFMIGPFGLDAFVGDVYRGEFFGGRLFARPFTGFFDDTEIGVSGVWDTRPDRDAYDAIKIFASGVDLGVPLIRGPVSLKFVADYATMGHGLAATSYGPGLQDSQFDNNAGFSVGFQGNLAFLAYEAGYRYLRGGYIPRYFGTTYDVERSTLAQNYILESRSDFKGWIVGMGADFGGIDVRDGKGKAAYFRLRFEEYYGYVNGVSSVDNNLYMIFELKKGVIPGFLFSFEYERANVVGSELFDQFLGKDTITTATIGYEITSGVTIFSSYKRYYKQDGTYDETYGIETSIGGF